MATLKAASRSETGTHKVRRLRKSGRVPAIIYGHGEQPVAISLDCHDVAEVVHHGARLLELDLDGKTENVLIKDLQYDHLGQDIIHADLTRVRLDERVEVTVPITLRGTPAGEGGVLNQLATAVQVECLVTSIPDEIRVSVAALNVGEGIKAGELLLPAGARLLDDPETVICTVRVVAEEEVAAEAPAEAVAQPEVIGAKKPEESEGQEESPGQRKQ